MKNEKKYEHVIKKVVPGSIAFRLGIKPDDVLLSVNGEEIEDVFDYQFLISDENLTLLVRSEDGEEREFGIKKDYEEDLGIVFESSLMDEYRSCRNDCIFCFIDQMPKGMRSTLYFKDDDSRLSFLQGNYVTLTNMTDHDIDRIIRYHMEPINISFHTMNPALRCRMLRNRFAGDIFSKVDRLYEANIEMNGQIVLCRGINDGAELEYSISEMVKYLPVLRSVSVVPVGLTRYRDGLYPLEAFDEKSAGEVIDLIEKWQKKIFPEYGLHFVHASDEWYIMAKRPFPEEERYDGYLQLENGVGMMRLLYEEVLETLKHLKKKKGNFLKRTGLLKKRPAVRRVSVATGWLAGPYIRELCGQIQEAYPEVDCSVFEIRNDFFGDQITVAGLITGKDLIAQLKNKDLGDELLLTCSMLRSGERVFLDDITVEELEEALQIRTRIVKSDGHDFVMAVTGLEE